MPRTVITTLVLAAGLAVAGRAQQPASLATLKTTAEASDYKSTSTYDDVVRFMKTVAEASPVVHYTTYGTTYEGRAMPMAVVGTGLKDSSAASVKATGKLRVHIQGNIHAGEVEGKEAAQVLLREFGLGQHTDWLQSTVFLVTPIFNADGNEKFALTNRPRQNGPINGMGTRANGQGLNINRDFTKLETPEGRAFAKLWTDYDPHVGFDLHTSDGSTHGYYLTYSPPLNPDTSDKIMKILTDEWFPYVTKDVKAKHGWDMFYYGNASSPGGRGGRGRGGAPGGNAQAAGRGGAAAAGGRAGAGGGRGGGFSADPTGMPPSAGTMRAWRTFEHVPRFHNNYVGLRNRFGLLSEAYAYATFEDRIKATNYFLESALDFANAHAAELKQAVADADRESIVGQTLGTRAQIKTGGTVDILMGEVEDEVNPLNGAIMNRRKDVTKVETMTDQMWFESTTTELVPAEFYVPAEATKVLDLLRAHGITIRQVAQPVTGVEAFTITSNTARPARQSIDFGMHELRTIEGEWKPSTVTVPAGAAWAVPMNQPLARLAFYLLAPTSDDGVLNWNLLDDLLPQGGTLYPIVRKK
jgi:Zinc carboxypeptidase